MAPTRKAGPPGSRRRGIIAERARLEEDRRRDRNWKRWGPYLAERQWGTVREDYSADGACWEYFTHDQARSRAYRWGEDGLLGITDRECRLALALAVWNGRDPILKERLFGLTGPEGNHGEDVKELYWYLDATPTSSYLKALYRYPTAAYPYQDLVDENRKRSRLDPEYEILDTGVMDDNRFVDIMAEYAKAGPDDILMTVTVTNHGPEEADLHLLPTLWFRNTWSWGRSGEGYWARPSIRKGPGSRLDAEHETLGKMALAYGSGPDGNPPEVLFTGNETNAARLFGGANASPYVKDAFHERVVNGRLDAVSPDGAGTKAALWYRLTLPAGGSCSITLRLTGATEKGGPAFGKEFQQIVKARRREADEFYAAVLSKDLNDEERSVSRQAAAGLLWSKQFFHYVVTDWLEGDPGQARPPDSRRSGRNAGWSHLFNRDIISMPDGWEYPWYAAWDLAFHMIPMARLDPEFAKEQLVLFLREWYMHPNGQMAAYEFALDDVNPPVHAWAAWRVYKMTAVRGRRDRVFLARCFQKLLLNFTWWVNRKDADGQHIFSGGFLGLDNIGVFDRSKPLPTGGQLEQADGTAWMAFYCTTMLSMALELARDDPAYEDVASKFFEHFVAISDAMNLLGGNGLWDEGDGFYYDQIHVKGKYVPLKLRSMVGLLPLITCEILEDETIAALPGFRKRMEWFLANRKDLVGQISYMTAPPPAGSGKGTAPPAHRHRLLAIPSRERLLKVVRYLLDESEFLSPHGLRSLSKTYEANPYVLRYDGQQFEVGYAPAEGDTGLFGGNSNWRGPIWFPVNWLIIEALERYHHFYGDDLTVEFPTGSGRQLNLKDVASELARRLGSIFLPDDNGRRPVNGGDTRYAGDPAWKDLVHFFEYFHGDTGRGAGASHQTGWTALVIQCLEETARLRAKTGRT